MTAQFPERVFYNGTKYPMCSEPLSIYLERKNFKKEAFKSQNSACWRGYRGTWEIKGNKLFLVEFSGYIDSNISVGIEYLFPDQTEVFAKWFTGVVRLVEGSLLRYEHVGYASTYETDIILTFKRGILIKEEIKDNLTEFNEHESLETTFIQQYPELERKRSVYQKVKWKVKKFIRFFKI